MKAFGLDNAVKTKPTADKGLKMTSKQYFLSPFVHEGTSQARSDESVKR